MPVRNDFLVLTAEAEPKLVYLFILAFGKSHEKSGYLNLEGGESESTLKLSLTSHSALGRLLLNEYLLIQYPLIQRSEFTKKVCLSSVSEARIPDCLLF